MDPASILLMLALKTPGLAASAAAAANTPGKADIAKMQASLVDFSTEVLKCYHKTARFGSVDVIGAPWNRQAQYNADKSVVLRIKYFGGISQLPYEIAIGVLGKNEQIRTAVIADSAVLPYSKRCELENWTPPAGAAK